MHCTVIRHRVLISCTEINSHTTGWKYRQFSTAFMRSKIKGALNEKSMPYKAELIREGRIVKATRSSKRGWPAVMVNKFI